MRKKDKKQFISRINEMTEDFNEFLVEELRNDPELAKGFLEEAIKMYKDDGNTSALWTAIKRVANAQGGIGKLAKQIGLNRQHLYDILAAKHTPSFFNWLKIVRALGFRVRLERAE